LGSGKLAGSKNSSVRESMKFQTKLKASIERVDHLIPKAEKFVTDEPFVNRSSTKGLLPTSDQLDG